MSIKEGNEINNDDQKNDQTISINEEVVEFMEVERIIKKGKDKDGNILYKVKWKDFPESKATWEPIENLSSIIPLIKDYENEIKKKYFKYKRKIDKIEFIKYINEELYANVSWKKNYKENIPNSYILYREIKKNNPEKIIEYYEKCLSYGDAKYELAFSKINDFNK